MLKIEDRTALLLPLIMEQKGSAARPVAAPIARVPGPGSGISSLARAVQAPWQDLYRNRFRKAARDAHDRIQRLGDKASWSDKALARMHDVGAQAAGLIQRVRYGRTAPGRLG